VLCANDIASVLSCLADMTDHCNFLNDLAVFLEHLAVFLLEIVVYSKKLQYIVRHTTL